ncbi:MAG: ABC transporter transmembrane domain-containing protein [Bacteroidota bacterium]
MGKRRSQPPTEEEKRKVNREGLREILGIFRYLKPHLGRFSVGMFFLFLSTLTFLTLPYFLGELVDAATPGQDIELANPGRSAVPGEVADNFSGVALPELTVNEIALILVGILIAQAVFSYLRIYLFAQVSERTMADIRLDLYQRIITLRMHFFEQRRVGELTSRMASDVTQLQDMLSFSLAELLRQFLTLIVGLVILIFLISGKLTLFMLAVFPIIIIAAMIFGRFIRKLSKASQDRLAESNTVLEESFSAITIVKSFANEWLEIKRYRSALKEVVNTALKAAAFRGGFVSFIFLALFGGIILVIWRGAMMISTGEIEVGQLISFILYTGFIGGSVAGMGNLYGQLQKVIGASERLRELLQEEPEFLLPPEVEAGKTERLYGAISFQQVEFVYPSRPDVEVLKSVSMDIAQGNTIALVGHSGAGKSTIAQLLLRLYEISGGDILIDSKPISHYDFPQLRANIGIVPQEVILFGGTIQENIAYGRPHASVEEIQAAAEQANAWEFIKDFPEQLETVVGERGIRLSGGQRQRIAIARAILKDPAILILDEATSSLDAESEHLVQSALNLLMEGRTTVVIAHRLSTIRKADQIYVLESGAITEAGTHEELVAKAGVYNSLLKLQLSAD